MSVRRRTIDQWNPNDREFWEREGRYVARRNLIWSIFAEFLGFSVWQLWSVTDCGKGEPGQFMAVSHGSAPARFRDVEVGVA